MKRENEDASVSTGLRAGRGDAVKFIVREIGTAFSFSRDRAGLI